MKYDTCTEDSGGKGQTETFESGLSPELKRIFQTAHDTYEMYLKWRKENPNNESPLLYV